MRGMDDHSYGGEDELPNIADVKREELVNINADLERGELSPTYCTNCRSSTSDMETDVESACFKRILHRAPAQVRDKNKDIYYPMAFSIGPYHHGQPQFHHLERAKDKILNIMFGSCACGWGKALRIRSSILERIDEIRHFYGGLSKDEYRDEELAQMMLRDACFILCYMELYAGNNERFFDVFRSLALSRITSLAHDYVKLENQIPWWVIKTLISFTYDCNIDDDGKGLGEELICDFLSTKIFGYRRQVKRVPWAEGTENEPTHLLEAIRNTFVKEEIIDRRHSSHPTFNFRWSRRIRKISKHSRSIFEMVKHPQLSVKELKAKGIYFKPSSNYLNDIRFSSHLFWGVLHLPVLNVSKETVTLFSNIVALEMSPARQYLDIDVTSYIEFMKSIIENEMDVKVLQEKSIIVSLIKDREQIVRIFKEIHTHGVEDLVKFQDVRKKIDKHCSSKAKTSIAELINTYFRSPWTAIALFAATFLLCLTFLQTYYTMNPRGKN